MLKNIFYNESKFQFWVLLVLFLIAFALDKFLLSGPEKPSSNGMKTRAS